MYISFITFNKNLNYFQLREPVVEVNGVAITTGYWQERIQLQRINLLNQYQYLQFQQNFGLDTSQQQQQVLTALQFPDILGQQVLDQLVDEELIRGAVRFGLARHGQRPAHVRQAVLRLVLDDLPRLPGELLHVL